ncbi:MAG TPA: phenylalanine--tRNA ligase subunit alpha, partial [Anaerolineales bacterium]
MLQKLEEIQRAALDALEAVDDEGALENWRVAYLGRSAPLMSVFDQLGSLPKDERPAIGRRANEIKRALEASLAERDAALREGALQRSLQAERLDVTLPGRPLSQGRLHPITQTYRQIARIFAEMGFQVYRSRDIETDEYNFQLLNFPPHHPAREMQDSFYIDSPHEEDNPLVLRTHTSPGQIRSMREFSSS